VAVDRAGTKENLAAGEVRRARRKAETPVARTDTSGSAGRGVVELARMETWMVSAGFRLGAEKWKVSP